MSQSSGCKNLKIYKTTFKKLIKLGLKTTSYFWKKKAIENSLKKVNYQKFDKFKM